MGLFIKKSKQSPQDSRPSEISRSVTNVFRLLGTEIAQKLSAHEQKMSIKQKKIIITLFCIISPMLWMAELYHGLYSKPTQTTNFLAKPGISTAVTPHLPDSIIFKLERLKQLRLDSLKKQKASTP